MSEIREELAIWVSICAFLLMLGCTFIAILAILVWTMRVLGL